MRQRVGALSLLGFAVVFLGLGSGHTRDYTMPSESMEPAFSVGEVVTVDLDAYDSAKPAIGDAVVELAGVPEARRRDAGRPLEHPQGKAGGQRLTDLG